MKKSLIYTLIASLLILTVGCQIYTTGKVAPYGEVCKDIDLDGYYLFSSKCPSGNDCDDTKPDIHPGATEICDNSIDEDCDGVDNRCLIYVTRGIQAVEGGPVGPYGDPEQFNITLSIDVDETAGINAFVITEYYPYGWEVISASHGGVYNSSYRLNEGITEWLGSEFTELGVVDAIISYETIKTNNNRVFDGNWLTTTPPGEGITEGDTII